MKAVVCVVSAGLVFYAASIFLIVLASSVGTPTVAIGCSLSHSEERSIASNVGAHRKATDESCGVAAAVTLPGSAVINFGLPRSYFIPANATAAESVAITYALAQLGKTYLWGGIGPAAFDCSGLTMMAWAQAGVTLQHYTGDQINEGTPVSSYSAISPGDLVLVPGSEGTVANPGHVGLYIGDGLVESAVDVQYGVIVQPYSVFVSGGLSGIRHVG